MILFMMAFFVKCRSLASFCSCTPLSSIALAPSTESTSSIFFAKLLITCDNTRYSWSFQSKSLSSVPESKTYVTSSTLSRCAIIASLCWLGHSKSTPASKRISCKDWPLLSGFTVLSWCAALRYPANALVRSMPAAIHGVLEMLLYKLASYWSLRRLLLLGQGEGIGGILEIGSTGRYCASTAVAILCFRCSAWHVLANNWRCSSSQDNCGVIYTALLVIRFGKLSLHFRPKLIPWCYPSPQFHLFKKFGLALTNVIANSCPVSSNSLLLFQITQKIPKWF